MASKTYAQLFAEIDAELPTNGLQSIAALNHRIVLHDMLDSMGLSVTPETFGAFGDGNSHRITPSDIAANPQWIGPYNQLPLVTYPVGTEWDYIGWQEMFYSCFAPASTPGNVVWSTNNNRFNKRIFAPGGFYLINRQLWLSASGWSIQFDNKLGTKLRWQGYSALDKSDFSSYFSCNSHSNTTLDGISAADIAQLHVGMNVREIVNTQDTGGIPWGTTIAAISAGTGTVTLSGNAIVTKAMKVFVWTDMLHMDSTAYGVGQNMCLQADALIPRATLSGGGTSALMTIDNTVPFSTLSPQFLSFYDCDWFGSNLADVGISIVPIAGGSGQGSNIQFIMNSLSNCPRAGLRVSGSNALTINWFGGDIQGCPYDGISGQAMGGQVQACSFENQVAWNTSAPYQSQLTMMGRDILANGVGGTQGNAVEVRDVRSESNVGVVCNNGGPAMVKDYGITNTNVFDWGANQTYRLGEVILPTTNNTKGRVFICVDTGGENVYRVTDQSSAGDTIVITPDPGWSPSQWVGFQLIFRFDSTFPQFYGPITSSTHNSVTVLGSGMGNNITPPNNDFYTITILGASGGSAPNFDSLAGANFVQPGATGQGFFAHAGTSTVGCGGDIGGSIVVGNAIIVRDAAMVGCFNSFTRQTPFPLISPVSAINPGTPSKDLTVKVPVVFGNSGSNGTDGYWGATLTDGQVKWMELPYSAYEGCRPLENAEGGNGYARSCDGIKLYQTNRLDGPGLTNSNFANQGSNGLSSSGDRNQFINYDEGPTWIRPQNPGTSSGTIDLTSRIETSNSWQHTPTGATTYNFPDFSAGVTGLTFNREFLLEILTSGTTSFTLTFGTNALSTGTLTTGTVDSKRFIIRWYYDGVKWIETSRTGAL